MTIPGKSIHQELAFYKEAGLSNYEVLKTATINPSKTHKFLNDLGTIESGKVANLLLIDDNPLDNLAALEQPQIVFSGGRMINRTTLDTFEVKAAERSNLLAQAATLQMEAREKGHLHIALGAINTAARLAQIIS